MSVVINVWFWATSIVWVVDGVIPPKYEWLVHLNPVVYAIEGYRGSFLYQQPFWANSMEGIYVWTLALIFAVVGTGIVCRLTPHFGDVL